MHTPRIKALDMLQIQTKILSYPSNDALHFELKDNVIHAQPKKTIPIQHVDSEGNVKVIAYRTTTHTISDNTTLAHYIDRISFAIENDSLQAACLELTELLPHHSSEIDLEAQVFDLLTIYSLYHCFLYLVWQLPISNPVVTTHMERAVTTVIKDQEHLCWAFVCFANMALFNGGIRNNFDSGIKNIVVVTPPKIYEIMEADSLFTALVYQLLMHIAAPNDAKRGGFASCAACGKTFFREYMHKKYCEFCERPSERTKACRAKKRKEALNAQESNP